MGLNDRFNPNELEEGIDPGEAQAVKVLTLGSSNDLALDRSSGSYGYGINIDADDVFNIAGSSKKSYALQISGDRDSAYPVTGDSNDAIVKITGNNYAANDANFILRGINASINQRSGGLCGRLEHSFGTQNKSGGTVTTLLGMTVVAENYGTLAGTDTFGGIDVLLKNEAAVAATEFGLRLRNENNSVAGPVAAALLISDTGANTGWTTLIDASGATINGSVISIAEDGTVAEKDNSQAITNLTTAGFLKILVGGQVRYIWLASNAPSA